MTAGRTWVHQLVISCYLSSKPFLRLRDSHRENVRPDAPGSLHLRYGGCSLMFARRELVSCCFSKKTFKFGWKLIAHVSIPGMYIPDLSCFAASLTPFFSEISAGGQSSSRQEDLASQAKNSSGSFFGEEDPWLLHAAIGSG